MEAGRKVEHLRSAMSGPSGPGVGSAAPLSIILSCSLRFACASPGLLLCPNLWDWDLNVQSFILRIHRFCVFWRLHRHRVDRHVAVV